MNKFKKKMKIKYKIKSLIMKINNLLQVRTRMISLMKIIYMNQTKTIYNCLNKEMKFIVQLFLLCFN